MSCAICLFGGPRVIHRWTTDKRNALTKHGSPKVHTSQFNNSQFIVHSSQFIVHSSQLTAHSSQLIVNPSVIHGLEQFRQCVA